MIKKPSFLERITGSITSSKEEDFEEQVDIQFENEESNIGMHSDYQNWNDDTNSMDGELPIDMYQTRDAIVIRALVAGVNPEDLNISITRDMVTLQGQREEVQEAPDEDYYHRELFWGAFSRTLLLPEEVFIDEAEAQEKHGMLEIKLPKVDKERSARLKVRTNVVQK